MTTTATNAKLATELWKILRAFERTIQQLPMDQQARPQAQLRFTRGRLVDLANEAGFRIASFDGEPYTPNLPVTAINTEEAAGIDDPVVIQTIEPAIVAEGQVVLMGKVVIGSRDPTTARAPNKD